MMSALRREAPELSFAKPLGGYYLWVSLPSAVSGDEVAAAGQRGGVIVIAGSRFYANGDAGHPRNRIRIAYSHASGDEIDEGVRRLTRAYGQVADRRAAAVAR
jgi:2-aminoadipate transaminase